MFFRTLIVLLLSLIALYSCFLQRDNSSAGGGEVRRQIEKTQVVCTGQQNIDTNRLASRIKNAGNGAYIVVKNTCRINRPLQVKADNIVIDGEGTAKIIARNPEKPAIGLNQRRNVTIRRIKVKNELGNGIHLLDSKNVLIEDVVSRGNGGNGIVIEKPVFLIQRFLPSRFNLISRAFADEDCPKNQNGRVVCGTATFTGTNDFSANPENGVLGKNDSGSIVTMNLEGGTLTTSSNGQKGISIARTQFNLKSGAIFTSANTEQQFYVSNRSIVTDTVGALDNVDITIVDKPRFGGNGSFVHCNAGRSLKTHGSIDRCELNPAVGPANPGNE